MIEPGRCNQTATDRNCPFCGSNQIEDEVDFLFDCCKYSLIRNNFDQWTDELIWLLISIYRFHEIYFSLLWFSRRIFDKVA